MNDNPQNIWQNQPTEPFKMSLEDLRRKMQQRERSARMKAIFGIVVGLVLFALFARMSLQWANSYHAWDSACLVFGAFITPTSLIAGFGPAAFHWMRLSKPRSNPAAANSKNAVIMRATSGAARDSRSVF